MLADPSRAPFVQVHILATLRAALRAFYDESENDQRGSGHVLLELRAYMCGARGGEVVVGSGGIATAISSYEGGAGCPGPSGGIQTLCVMRVMLPYKNVRLSLKLMITREPNLMHGFPIRAF